MLRALHTNPVISHVAALAAIEPSQFGVSCSDCPTALVYACAIHARWPPAVVIPMRLPRVPMELFQSKRGTNN